MARRRRTGREDEGPPEPEGEAPGKEGEEPGRERRVRYIPDFITGKPVRATPEEVEARQVFERRLVEEYGYAKAQILPDFLIQKGSQRIGPADIVVFHDDRKEFDNVYIVVETKRRDRTDGIDQVKSYSISPAQRFAVWFNGNDVTFLEKRERPPYFRKIPDIPKQGETLEDVGLYQKRDLVPATNLISVFETCHNYLYANEGLLKEKVFNEVLKLIFIKMADEKTASPKCEFRITDGEMTELEQGKRNGFVARITDLFERVKAQYSDVFSPQERIGLKPLSIAFVVSQLQKYSLMGTAADVKGTAFQTFVYDHERGERGEFFTPQPVVDMAVRMLDPRDDEKVIDPACGTGGFLVRTMIHVREAFLRQRPDMRDRVGGYVKEYAHAYIAGADINPDLAKVAKMHMVLYDDGHTGIFATNSLLPSPELVEAAKNSGVIPGLLPKPGSFRIVVTNPPFGARGRVTDKTILRQFDLARRWVYAEDAGTWQKTEDLLPGQVPDILFLERCLALLQPGGRLAIVFPDGNLTNPSLGYVVEYVKRNARILAVVSLPPETFLPHGAGSKASVLFLQKLPEEELTALRGRDYPIFMASLSKIGYDVSGRPVRRRDDAGRYLGEDGQPVQDERNAALDTDLPAVLEAWRGFLERHRLRL